MDYDSVRTIKSGFKDTSLDRDMLIFMINYAPKPDIEDIISI